MDLLDADCDTIGNEKVKDEYDGFFKELILMMLNMDKRSGKKRKVEKGKVEECHDH